MQKNLILLALARGPSKIEAPGDCPVRLPLKPLLAKTLSFRTY